MRVERPLAIDLFTGLHGWAEGAIASGFRVRGYDIVDMSAEIGERKPEHFELVLQDVLTLHGSQLKDAELILASPPCQRYSYMAMPFRRGRQIARALRGRDEFPDRYDGPRTIAELNALFDACFRIKAEASEAAGRDIPLVVENVKGAQPWVGRARWSFGSYYLWGDVPALMPKALSYGTKHGGDCFSDPTYWGKQGGARKNPGFRFDGSGRSFQSESVERHVEGRKSPRVPHVRDGAPHTRHLTHPTEGSKGGSWFEENDGPLRHGHSKSPARKAASAKIAKIPLALSTWIARTYYPAAERVA